MVQRIIIGFSLFFIAACSQPPIEPYVTVGDIVPQNGKATLSGETNFPNGTLLVFQLKNDTTSEESNAKLKVNGSQFNVPIVGPPIAHGKYSLFIYSKFPKGHNFSGPDVETLESGEGQFFISNTVRIGTDAQIHQANMTYAKSKAAKLPPPPKEQIEYYKAVKSIVETIHALVDAGRKQGEKELSLTELAQDGKLVLAREIEKAVRAMPMEYFDLKMACSQLTGCVGGRDGCLGKCDAVEKDLKKFEETVVWQQINDLP